MAKIIFEDREFTNRETGITTNYQYIAIKGGSPTKQFEVQLKNLVQSEKVALSMINDLEAEDANKGEVVLTNKHGEVDVTKKEATLFDDDDEESGFLD